ncbi:MAG: DUF2281 domain-containing protein [Magnetococcales bacterium]|nr:DUF2281 domain-containing protein [Magnetococcales bacterium]
MSYAELIKKMETLPWEKQSEVFDFVEFLVTQWGKSRELPSPPHVVWNDAEFSALSMSQALRGMEDDPTVYSLEDLRERWQ